MTTPTREQVVQWAREAQGSFSDGLVLQAWLPFMTRLTTLARADLEATIAEQAAEIERLKIEADPEALHIAYLYGSASHKCVDWSAENEHLRQQLTESQAYAAQLREALERASHDLYSMTDPALIYRIAQLIAIQPDETALREHDARLVERITGEMHCVRDHNHCEKIADKIRKGGWK